MKLLKKSQKDTIVDPVIKICIESNHAEEFYTKFIQDMDISFEDLDSYKDKELTNLK